MQKVLEKEGQGAWLEEVKKREKVLEEAKINAIAQLEKSTSNRKQYLDGLFKFFYIGRKLSYPVQSYDGGHETVLGVFIGFVIDKKKKNPYAPSAPRFRM